MYPKSGYFLVTTIFLLEIVKEVDRKVDINFFENSVSEKIPSKKVKS